MYNTRYLPENFEQCGLEKTILRQFPYNLNVRSSKNDLVQDGGNTTKRPMSRKPRNDSSLHTSVIVSP